MNITGTNYKTPAERLEAIEIADAKLDRGELVEIIEPCNCGSMIRHNNGGNYHQIVYLKKENDGYYVKFDLTSDLEAPAEWQPTDEAFEIIRELSDWL